MTRHSIAFALAICAVGCRSVEEDPNRADVRFGVVADIQYADKDTAGARRYRESLESWEQCVLAWNAEDLDFVIQLGDLIDGREDPCDTKRDLDYVLGVMAALDHPLRHVVGNHCLTVPRAELLRRLRLEQAFYSFSDDGWRFVVLDSLAISQCGWPAGSEPYVRATEWLEEMKAASSPNAQAWNGAVGEVQRDWLRAELAEAQEAGERVLVFAHAPVLAEASTPAHLAWDHAEVLAVLAEGDSVVAYFAGHDHAGGYARAAGIHHVTLEGLVESDPEQGAHGVVELHEDRIEILGSGGVTSRTLALEAAPEPTAE